MDKRENAILCRCRHEHLEMKITLATAATLEFKGRIINAKKSQKVLAKTYLAVELLRKLKSKVRSNVKCPKML
jgi:hypothetical protein